MGDLREREGRAEDWAAAVEMLRESLGLTERDASILAVWFAFDEEMGGNYCCSNRRLTVLMVGAALDQQEQSGRGGVRS